MPRYVPVFDVELASAVQGDGSVPMPILTNFIFAFSIFTNTIGFSVLALVSRCYFRVFLIFDRVLALTTGIKTITYVYLLFLIFLWCYD